MILLKIAGYISATILVVLLAFILLLVVYYTGKYTIEAIKKGDADDD